jgi:ferric-dicitrate binding protein FerR (iron transport regulator)
MNRNLLRELLDKYITNAITEEERSLLFEMIESPDYLSELRRIVGSRLEQDNLEGEEDVQLRELIYRRMKAGLQGDASPAPVKRTGRTIWWRWATAAAVFLLVAAAGYFLLSRKDIHRPEVTATPSYQKNDLLPGGNKAMLTLANGTRIVLDSAHNGQLASQGNMAIIKVSSGMLTYRAESRKQKAESEVSYNTLSTPRGGQFQLVLPDGSKVWLNAASSIRFPTAFVRERKVEITGEAYFEVAHNASMPFRVQAGNEIVEDLGTGFNINAYDDEPNVRTTLLQGSVRVSAGGKAELLTPGQQSRVSRDGHIKLVDHVDMDEAVAWKNGVFSFDSTDIYNIMRQISRWYNVDIVFRDSLNVYLDGNINRDVKVSRVFKMLELAGGVRFGIENGKIIVMKP